MYINQKEEEKPNISLSKTFKLPPIYPIVFYNGVNKWTATLEFKEKVKSIKEFEKHIPNFQYIL
jgi:hypothetical protein